MISIILAGRLGIVLACIGVLAPAFRPLFAQIKELIETIAITCPLTTSNFWLRNQHKDCRKCRKQGDKEAEQPEAGKQGELMYGGYMTDKQGGQTNYSG